MEGTGRKTSVYYRLLIIHVSLHLTHIFIMLLYYRTAQNLAISEVYLANLR